MSKVDFGFSQGILVLSFIILAMDAVSEGRQHQAGDKGFRMLRFKVLFS